jgi:predicted metal-dependent HD superfamily phosphohydrolase
MAIWFHDVIYEPGQGYNEDKSAKWASMFSRIVGMSDIFSKRVQYLILATKHDKIPEEMDAKYIIDIDLSIFGQLGDIFLQYEEGIRKEYCAYDDEYYKQRRAPLLQDFLKRDFIYLTDIFQEKYEKSARKNLKYSIERLNT